MGLFVVGPVDMARWKQSWSEEELSKLRKLAGTKPMTIIAKELGRTTGTVLAKAIEQKLPVMHRIERTTQ
ncbi:putative iron-regulated protein [Bradyrhizobium sp. GM24.11]